MSVGSKNWTKSEDSKMIAGLLEGKAASKIALTLPGRTRSAVIGRFHRLRIEGKLAPDIRLGMPTKHVSRRSAPKHVQRNHSEIVFAEGNGCRYPMWGEGYDEKREYCGEDRIEGTSYCAKHLVMCYRDHGKLKEAQDILAGAG